MTKWWYCYILGGKVHYFTADGEKTQVFKNESAAIFALGSDGWEMVATVVSTLYFKKPMQS